MNTVPGLRVLLADDHALFRAGLASLLRAWGLQVVGQAANGQEPKVSAALAVDQDPAKSAGAVYKVTGSGFLPSSVVFLNFSDPVCCVAIAASPDNLGNISVDRKTGKPGIYRVEAFQRIDQKLLLVATLFFEVTNQGQ